MGEFLDDVARTDPSWLRYFLMGKRIQSEGAREAFEQALTRASGPEIPGALQGGGGLTSTEVSKPSSTDEFNSVEGKLTLRMRQGFFHVLDLEEVMHSACLPSPSAPLSPFILMSAIAATEAAPS